MNTINGKCTGCGDIVVYVLGLPIGGAPGWYPSNLLAVSYAGGHLCDLCATEVKALLRGRYEARTAGK